MHIHYCLSLLPPPGTESCYSGVNKAGELQTKCLLGRVEPAIIFADVAEWHTQQAQTL